MSISSLSLWRGLQDVRNVLLENPELMTAFREDPSKALMNPELDKEIEIASGESVLLSVHLANSTEGEVKTIVQFLGRSSIAALSDDEIELVAAACQESQDAPGDPQAGFAIVNVNLLVNINAIANSNVNVNANANANSNANTNASSSSSTNATGTGTTPGTCPV